MQVFIVGTPLETAKNLDPKRLNKQILECEQIKRAITTGTGAWSNHPVTKMYKEHLNWLEYYQQVFKSYKNNDMVSCNYWNERAVSLTPEFHTVEFLDQMKRRLFTKNNDFYSQWSYLGTSAVNWYYVENKWLYYINGKQIIKS